MGAFSLKELEITDYIVEQINSEIFCAEQDETDKRRLEYSLCSTEKERLEVTKKRLAKYKSKIDKCDPDIAGYLTELVRHNSNQIDDGELRDNLTRNFVIYHYQELIEELAPIGKGEFEDYVFSSIVKSKGHSYKKIKNYIEGVFNIIQYTNFKSFLNEKNQDSNDSNTNLLKNIGKFSNHKHINDFVCKILNNEISKFEAITYINGITTKDTIELFIKEFNDGYYNCTNDFRLSLSSDIMLEIINSNIDNLEYTYLNEEMFVSSKFPDFIRKVSDFEFVINVHPKFEESDINIHKLIYVNELCIDFDPDYPFGNKGQEYYEVYNDFGNVKFLKEIFIHLNQKGDSIHNIKENVIDDGHSTFKEVNLEQNPYPKIFKNHKAFTIFNKLLEDFGNTKENLSNYSFVFHKMTYEDLIHNDLKQKSYFDFLGDFDISITRIKPKTQLGKSDLRESIYNKAKT